MVEDKRQIKEINASSMADIAFLLLIFFLVATTMNVDTGIQRILPSIPTEETAVHDMDVKERNLLNVFVNTYGQILVARQPMHISQLKDKFREFILNPDNDENLPSRKDTEIRLPDGSIWVYPVSEGIVSITTDRGTDFDVYIQVQNELSRALNEVRDMVAMQKYKRKFMELTEEQRNVIVKAVPQRISESEPRNAGGR